MWWYILKTINNKSLLIRSVNILISIFSMFYMLKVFNVEQFGKYAIFITVIKIAPFIVNFNIQEYLFKIIPLSKNRSGDLSEDILSILVPVIFSSVSIGILLIVIDFNYKIGDLFFVILLSIIMSISRFISSFFIYNDEILKYTFFDFLNSTLWIVPFIAISHYLYKDNVTPSDLFEIRFVFSFLIVSVYIAYIVKKYVNIKLSLIKYVIPSKVIMRFSLLSLPSILIISMVEIMDRWVLSFIGTDVDVGFLGFILMPSNVLYGLVTTVLISPEISKISQSSYVNNDKIYFHDFNNICKGMIFKLLLLSFFVYLGFYVIAIYFFYDKYSEAIPFVIISLFLVVFNSLNYYCRFIILNHSKGYINKIYLFSIVIGFILNVFLSYLWGFVGCIIGSIITSVIVFIFMIKKVKDDRKEFISE